MKSSGLSRTAGPINITAELPALLLSPADFIANINKTVQNYAVNWFLFPVFYMSKNLRWTPETGKRINILPSGTRTVTHGTAKKKKRKRVTNLLLVGFFFDLSYL